MSDRTFKPFIIKPMRIQDVTGGIYDAAAKELITIHGPAKKVFIVATVMDKEFIEAMEQGKRHRCVFQLEDGTGMIEATWFGENPGEIEGIEPGDVVKVAARASTYQNRLTLIIDNIKQVKDFTEELYHRARVGRQVLDLMEAGKPVVLENGGTIINDNADVLENIFSTEAGKSQDLDSLEEPITFDDGGDFSFEVKDSFKPHGERMPDDTEGASWLEPAGGGDEGGMQSEPYPDIDPSLVKESILETVFQGDFDAGITVDELQEALGYPKEMIERYLEEMETEGLLAKTDDGGGGPVAYRPA